MFPVMQLLVNVGQDRLLLRLDEDVGVGNVVAEKDTTEEEEIQNATTDTNTVS